MEEFRDIKDFKNYQVSNLGRIYSKKRRACLKVKRLAGRGYYQVRLSKDGIYYYKNLHRLIAETFIPNPNNLRTVNHINGNKLDNRVENLEIMTVGEHRSLHNKLKPVKRGSDGRFLKIGVSKSGNIGESCDANPEISTGIANRSGAIVQRSR